MELAFLTSAGRRYWWLIGLCALLGAIPGLVLVDGGQVLYESRAVLLISPPTDAQTVVNLSGDPDRYVAGEMSVLESLSEQVAEEVGIDPGDLDGAVSFEQQPETDVVIVVVANADPEVAQQLADTFISQYFSSLRQQLSSTVDPAIEEIDAEIATVRDELTELDEQITDQLAPFLDREAVPSVEQVAPTLATEKEALLARLAELETQRSELSRGLRVQSRLVRDATLPTEPLGSSRRTFVAAGLVAGGFLGLLAAVLIARVSSVVLDDEQAEEVIGHPVLGVVPERRDLDDRSALLGEQAPEVARFLDRLSIRVQLAGTSVVVAGSRPGAGATSLAASLAVRLAESGQKVLLVDGDRNHSELADLFIVDVGRGLSNPEGPGALPVTPVGVMVVSLDELTATVRSGDDTKLGARTPIEQVIAAGREFGEVIVFDGGPLLDSVTTVELSRHCDSVVLAMPHGEKVRSLQAVVSLLRDRSSVLPVWTPAKAHRQRLGLTLSLPFVRDHEDQPA